MLRLLDAVTAWASRIMLFLGGLSLVGMMCLACANMTLRAVWVPVKGTFELMGFFGALAAAFALGYTQLHKGHIAVTVMAGMLPKRVERYVDALGSLVCSAFFALACRESVKFSGFLRDTGELSETLHIIYHPFTYAVAAGLGVLALALFVDFLRGIAPVRTHSGEPEWRAGK